MVYLAHWLKRLRHNSEDLNYLNNRTDMKLIEEKPVDAEGKSETKPKKVLVKKEAPDYQHPKLYVSPNIANDIADQIVDI
ncbi:hypothetical protein FRC12_021143 [Ceratobasidium sp. 428]|nr:hypothetical protein FRC12_021143 [Ceratobasidium sp. 428]